MKRRVMAVVMALCVVGATQAAALAAKPGPGSKQCVPGQQGNPKPAHKAGVCPNPGK